MQIENLEGMQDAVSKIRKNVNTQFSQIICFNIYTLATYVNTNKVIMQN